MTDGHGGRRRRGITILACTLAIAGGLVLSQPHVPASRAEVPLQCNGADERDATDKLPREGVVIPIVDEGTTYYVAATVTDDGSLEEIPVNGNSYNFPLVSVWQNGTDCAGDEDSRSSWAVAPNGTVFSEGVVDPGSNDVPAGFYGQALGIRLNRPIVGMSPTTTGNGYWLVASDGGIFSYGDARFFGSTGSIRLNKPIVGMSATPSGRGYWMVATDGGIFSFGDAPFYGSTGAIRLNRPITGMTATPSGHGYWMVADDGGIFTFGDAPFLGSLGGERLPSPIVGMIPNGDGYTLVAQDGTLYFFDGD